MKVVLLSLVVAVLVGAGAMMALGNYWNTSASAYSTGGARVGDPGHNLVGSDWYAGKKDKS